MSRKDENHFWIVWKKIEESEITLLVQAKLLGYEWVSQMYISDSTIRN